MDNIGTQDYEVPPWELTTKFGNTEITHFVTRCGDIIAQFQSEKLCVLHSIANAYDLCLRSKTVLKYFNEYYKTEHDSLPKNIEGFDDLFKIHLLRKLLPSKNFVMVTKYLKNVKEKNLDNTLNIFLTIRPMYFYRKLTSKRISTEAKNNILEDMEINDVNVSFEDTNQHAVVLKKYKNDWCFIDSIGISFIVTKEEIPQILSVSTSAIFEQKTNTGSLTDEFDDIMDEVLAFLPLVIGSYYLYNRYKKKKK